MMLLTAYLLFALGVSFLCSLLEAALLSLPKSHIAALIERGDPTGERLRRMKDDIDQPLAAIGKGIAGKFGHLAHHVLAVEAHGAAGIGDVFEHDIFGHAVEHAVNVTGIIALDIAGNYVVEHGAGASICVSGSPFGLPDRRWNGNRLCASTGNAS